MNYNEESKEEECSGLPREQYLNTCYLVHAPTNWLHDRAINQETRFGGKE